MKRPRRIAALAERGFTPVRGLGFPYARLMTAKIVLHMFAPATLSRFGTLEEVDKALWHKIPVNAGENAQKALEDYTSDQSKFEKIIQLLAKTMTQQSADVPVAD